MLRRMPIRCNPQRMGEQPKRRTGGHVARVVRIEQTGGPEVMRWIDMDLPAPGPGEVRIRTTAVGLNFIDIYHRRGDYRLPLPTGLGSESVGVVEAVGPGVTGLAEGDRVATFGPERGAYATHRNLPAEHLSTLPDTVDDASAAALMLKGSTAQFLIERCAKVGRGHTAPEIGSAWRRERAGQEVLIPWEAV